MKQFTIKGIVQAGRQQGDRVGARTANIPLLPAEAQNLPKGLYAGEALLFGKIFPGLLYYGINFFTKEDCLEIHVLDFTGDLYGQAIVFTTRRYLRPPKYFNAVEELAEQIKKDLAAARRF